MTYRILVSSIALGSCVTLLASDSHAQCSANSNTGRQRGQLLTTGSQSLLTMPATNRSSLPTASMYAAQRLLSINSPDLMSMASQLSIQQWRVRAAYRERILPMRLARAQQSREKRAERIAMAKAKRLDATRYATMTQPALIASKLTLISSK